MTPPYSPQANSIVERANGIIVSTLKKLTDKNPDKWDELPPNALLAINTTKQNSTKKSPFYLLFGYEPRLPRELHIGSFIDDTPHEDQLDLILARAEAANNVYEVHLENKHRFHLHRRSYSFKAGDLVLYDWPKQGDHKLSPIFKGPFVIVRPVGAVCYEIKSRTLQKKYIKVAHVQHLRPYFKRDADVMQNNTSDEENDSSAENQDPAEGHQEVSLTTEPSSSRNHLRRNRRPPKRFEQCSLRLIFNYATISNFLCLFKKKILIKRGRIDEAHFWLNGYVNKQNCRIWNEANPQVYVETPLHPEKLTVWCALWAGGILLQKR
ncbi:transposon Ty3-G Gag-Pol polyprotein [Trichonephila clavipes]|nr:transposon Ty3-G Gag-Pol polyprotein [Trichonephila clavipes]